MKQSLIALAVLALAGCAGTFGHSAITVKSNTAGGYDLDVRDGKEYANGRTIMFTAKDGALAMEEGPSKAFKGQALGVKAINILPTMGLGDILAPRGE